MSKNSTYYNRKALGLCVFCGVPATNGTIRCDECRAKHSKETLKKYHQQRSEGLCRYCDKPAIVGNHLCADHIDRAREVWRSRRDENTKRRRQLRKDALEIYGNCCQDCGNSTRRLELHHIDGTGRIERSTITGGNAGGHRLHERLKREGYDPNIRLLCVNCHKSHHVTAP